MARLNGGKLLVDLTQSDVANDIYHSFTNEEYETILKKGLVVKLLSNDTIFVIEPSINEITLANKYIVYSKVKIGENLYGITINNGGDYDGGVILMIVAE